MELITSFYMGRMLNLHLNIEKAGKLVNSHADVL